MKMTGQEYEAKQNELLGQLPEEFRSCISYMAYDRGHSAGREEVINILSGLVNALLDPIREFEHRIVEISMRHR